MGQNVMNTTHKILYSDSRNMKEIKDNSVDLVITSPPYPMIKMWDSIFNKQNPEITDALYNDDGNRAFELMHKELDKVWKEVYRVLKQGGIVCLNIGDAVRTINGSFRLYTNHSRILQYCIELGFKPLPEILWKKRTNTPNKFMGSGMLPVGAYITLEHEYILILRKGNKRNFNTKEEKMLRQQSAFFWEERNKWFSDIWTDLNGTRQKITDKNIRERSGAFPFELPYRLINMFSVKGDTILDPFLGTGTTSLASIVAKRNSIGIEIEEKFREPIFYKVSNAISLSSQVLEDRLNEHKRFLKYRIGLQRGTKYINKFYGFPVITNQETNLVFDQINKIIINNNHDIFEIEYKDLPVIIPDYVEKDYI